MLLPQKTLSLIASFLSLFETALISVSLIGFGDKLNECLTSTLPGTKTPSVVKSHGPAEFERSLATPTVQIILRHDFRTILDFLLMNLRTALDRDWLQNLTLLHKVFHFLHKSFMLVRSSFNFSFYFSMFFDWNTRNLQTHRDFVEQLGTRTRPLASTGIPLP